MPNKVIAQYRQYLADTGQQDSTSDYDLTLALGQWAQQSNPALLEAFPDFAAEYSEIRSANAPSLSGELGRALKSGTQGLASTALGGLGLLTGSDYLMEKAASFEQDAAANAPTIPTLEDIAPGRKGVGTLFTEDAARYGLAKLGSVVPSIAEGVALAGAGALAGSAVAPGPGTIAGAAEGLVARGLIKSAVRSLVKKGVAEELAAKGIISEGTEAALEAALQSGVKAAADKVGLEAMAIGAKRGMAATNLANSFLLNAGDVASEGADRPTSIALGLVSAIPDSILPGYLVGRLFPGVKASQATDLAKQFVGDRAMKALTMAGITGAEAGTEYFQEAVNVVARNLKEGKDALDFNDADLRRFREAGIAGGFGGALAAPTVLIEQPTQTTAELPNLPGPTINHRPADQIPNPLAALSSTPSTAGVVTPFDTAREAAQARQSDEAGRLLQEQQAALAPLLNPPPVAPAETLGRAMMGETPETAAELQLRRRAFGMAGVPIPDASDPDQVSKAETEAAGRALLGNIAPELATPIAVPVVAPVAAPQSLSAAVSAMSPDEFFQWANAVEGGFTGQAYNEGIAAIGDAAKLADLKARHAQAQSIYDKASNAAKAGTPDEQVAASDSLMTLGSKVQFFREAVEAAENSGSARGDPTVKAAHEQVTLSQLPADIAANVAAPSAGAQPSPIAPQPGGDAATEAALPVPEQQGSGTEITTGPIGTRKSIAEQRKLIAKLEKDMNRAAQSNPKRAKKIAGQIEQEQAKLAQLVATKKTGRNISVGVGANGMPDILNFIEEMGGIRSARDEESAGTFNGTARLLLRRDGGLTRDDMASRLFDDGVLPDGLPATLDAAVQKAVTARQQQKKSAGRNEYNQRFEAAFLGDQRAKKWLMAGNPITVDDLSVGNTFEVNGEKFTVKDIDEDGNVTIQDGITKTYPAGTPVFPDKGQVKAKKGKKVDFLSDEEMAAEDPFAPPAANAGEIIPTSDMPFNLAGEQQDAGKSAVQLAEEKAARDAAVAAENAKQGGLFNALPAPVPDATKPTPVAVAAKPFTFGPVIQSAPTMDFRTSPQAESLTPEQWDQAANTNLRLGVIRTNQSSKSDAIVGVALRAPDGRVILTGLTLPANTLGGDGVLAAKRPTVQRMGKQSVGKRVVEVGGNQPLLLADAVRAGFKPFAFLRFTGEPGRIYETFPSQQAFDAAWGASPKTEGKAGVQPPALAAAVPRAVKTEAELISRIEKKGEELLRAKPEERPAIIQEIRALYAELDNITRQNQDLTGDTHPPEFRRGNAASESIQAGKHSQFQAVIANLQQLGMKVDVFSREILAQSTTEELQRRMAAIQQEAQAAQDPIVRAELMRRLNVLQERLDAVNQAAGVTYTPWHIAIAAEDIGQASANNLVTLLHEAAEALTMRLPVEQRGAVRTAVNKSLTQVRERAAAASAQTGVPQAQETSATDLLAETLAQELTAAGIPDSPNLAQAILRWVKDVYYRTAMALQAAFGAEASPETALDWYENQLRREVYGDYSYALGNIIDRFIPTATQERVRRFTAPLGSSGTPSSIPDFLDPVAGITRQPQVETLNRDALNWNLEYQIPGQPGQGLDIPDPEARARIKGGVLNALSDFYEKLRLEIAPDMEWNDFFAQIKRPAEEAPSLLISELNTKIAGSGDAKIGGERMTDPMNREANIELWGRLRKLSLSLRRQQSRGQQTIADATRQLTEAAQGINKLEGDVKNAALHEDQLKATAKELVRSLAQSIASGRNASHLQGALAESIRETEDLLEGDPIPQAYREVLKRVYDGEQPVFDYIRAIAELDLPFSEMTNAEVIRAIQGGADLSPPLANLTANRPLMVVLATLARKNAAQLDQIQLGWLRDTSRFREITDSINEIKQATASQLAELNRQFRERGKASGLKARLQASYLQKRRKQQAASDRIAAAEARNELIAKAIAPVDEATAEAAQAAGGAQYEWAPEEGAVWTAMREEADGTWKRSTRVLRFNPDGSAVDGDQLRRDIASNLAWLAARRADEGKPRYNQIAAQTYALKLLDARGQQQRTWNSGILNAVDRFVRTPIATARSLGGPAMQRVVQMLNRYQFILRNYQKSLEVPAAEWQHEFVRMRKAAGLTDNGEFIEQVYKPAMYFFSVNPGLEEAAAIRQAAALVRRSLQNPAEDFNERFTAFIRKTIQNEKALLSIAEQYGVFVADKQLGGELRRAVPRGILTGLRTMNGGVVDVLTKDMQNAGWKLRFDQTVADGVVKRTNPKAVTFAPLDPSKAEDPAEADAIWATLGNAEALMPLIQRLFTPAIIGQWLEPFIRKPGQEPFSFEGEPIPQELVRQAWDQSGGDVLGWIDRLGEMLEVEGTPEHSAAATFRLSMFRNLDALFGHEAKLAYDANQTPGLLDPHGAKPHALMDARVSDLLPPEHLDYSTYEPESMHRLLARVAYHGAFGRNAKNIQAAFRENMNYLQGKNAEFQTLASLHTSAAGRQAEAAARGWNYDELKTAAKRYDEMKDFQTQIEAVLGISANSGPLGDFHKAMSLMNFAVGQIVDNPKTAAYNLLSPAMRPFAQRSLGPKAITNTVKVYADILQTGLGSLFQSFGLHLFKAGKYADTIGNAEGRAFSNLPVSVLLSDIGHSGDNQAGLEKWLVKPLKIARTLQRKGAQLGLGEATEFPRLSVIPGLGVINSISNIEVQAGGSSFAREFEQLVRDGIAYFAAHPDAANNPSFKFKPSDLYKYKLDQPLYDWWNQKTVEYNMGTFEDIVRDAARRQAGDATTRLLTDDQALTLSMMNQNEFSGNSSINTTPGWLTSNQFLRMAMPLLRWPLWMMSSVHEAAKPKAGENAVTPMLRAMGTLALWNLPMGIAFSLLMDKYDEKLLGKKSNLPDVSGYSALPLVGLPLGLLSSDKPLGELEAMLVRSARAGNIYGLGQDVAVQTLIGLDPTTGQRSTSLDQRVLVMSQLTNLQQALLNYRNQGFATWGSVARPVLMAAGGNGVLHSIDITNKLLGLDNAQSRLVERAASSNWIRSAAQELDIEVRKGAFGGVPTPMSAHTREMYLAALANDRADFLEEYRLALNAARDAVAEDSTVSTADREKEARNRVLSSWRSRNPFAVLTAKPTPQQVQRMLAIMDPTGQESVRTAMQRYETYDSMIQPSAAEKFFERQMSSIRSQSDPESLRRRMTGSLMFSTR